MPASTATWAATLVFLLATPVLAGSITEVEPNDSLAQAQNIDSAFDLTYDVNIENSAGQNVSLLIPHAEIDGAGNGTSDSDWFSFTVANSGDIGIFDVDLVTNAQNETFDSFIRLYDNSGTLLDFSVDSVSVPVVTDTGSPSPADKFDDFLEYTFSSAGTYKILLDDSLQSNIPAGTEYVLNVSIGTPIPEPTSLALLVLGLSAAGLAARRRGTRR